MMKTSALPAELIEQQCELWTDTVCRGEVQTVVTFPVSGVEYRIQEFKEYFWKKMHREVMWIDQVFNQAEDVAQSFLSSNQPTLPVIAYGTRWLQPDLLDLFSALATHQHVQGLGMLCFVDSMPAKTLSDAKPARPTYFLDNLTYLPLLNQELSAFFMNTIANRWQFYLEKKIIKQIFQETGGHTWLMKQLLRELSLSDASLDQALHSQGYTFRVKTLQDLVTENQRQVISLVEQHAPIPPALQDEEAYLRSIGYISTEFYTNLPRFLRQLPIASAKMTITFTDEATVLFDSVRVDGALNPREIEILRLAVVKKNAVISREELGKLCWGEEYSDWALDAFIHRFRKKLTNLSSGRIKLLTQKGKGYQIIV